MSDSKIETIIYLLRNCVRPPDLDHLMQDAADELESLHDAIEGLRIDLKGAGDNRFYDQRDGYLEGLCDGKNQGEW